MSFIRPEATAALWRWREVLVGAGLGMLGLWWVAGPGGLLGLVGWVVIVAGGATAVVGVQRLRFRRSGPGPGVVVVDEGQITYFGPLTGGMVALSELHRLSLDPSAHPSHWLLAQPGQPDLAIPVGAKGADALFDVFAALPGLSTERMLAALGGGGAHPVVIWERNRSRVALPGAH